MKSFIEGKDRNIAYFIPVDGETDRGWNVAIAAEDVPHYYKTDWFWDCDHETAVKLVNEVNAKRGITEEESERIISSSVIASCKKETVPV